MSCISDVVCGGRAVGYVIADDCIIMDERPKSTDTCVFVCHVSHAPWEFLNALGQTKECNFFQKRFLTREGFLGYPTACEVNAAVLQIARTE